MTQLMQRMILKKLLKDQYGTGTVCYDDVILFCMIIKYGIQIDPNMPFKKKHYYLLKLPVFRQQLEEA